MFSFDWSWKQRGQSAVYENKVCGSLGFWQSWRFRRSRFSLSNEIRFWQSRAGDAHCTLAWGLTSHESWFVDCRLSSVCLRQPALRRYMIHSYCELPCVHVQHAVIEQRSTDILQTRQDFRCVLNIKRRLHSINKSNLKSSSIPRPNGGSSQWQMSRRVLAYLSDLSEWVEYCSAVPGFNPS